MLIKEQGVIAKQINNTCTLEEGLRKSSLWVMSKIKLFVHLTSVDQRKFMVMFYYHASCWLICVDSTCVIYLRNKMNKYSMNQDFVACSILSVEEMYALIEEKIVKVNASSPSTSPKMKNQRALFSPKIDKAFDALESAEIFCIFS